VSRTERLLELVQVLRRHRAPVRAEELASELGVSVRSVYRDVQTLRGQGAPIEGEAGVGYVLKPGFTLPPLMFSPEELEALVLGLRLAAEHGDVALGQAAEDAAAKIRAVLPRELRDFVDDTTLLAGPAGERPADGTDLAALRRAIREQHKVALSYRDAADRLSERRVWPIALGFFERARVLIAWCELRGAFRAFRTDRCAAIGVTSERFSAPRTGLLAAWRAQEGIPDERAGGTRSRPRS